MCNNKFIWFMILIIILILSVIPNIKENFITKINIHNGPKGYSKNKLISECNYDYQPCIMYRV